MLPNCSSLMLISFSAGLRATAPHCGPEAPKPEKQQNPMLPGIGVGGWGEL